MNLETQEMAQGTAPDATTPKTTGASRARTIPQPDSAAGEHRRLIWRLLSYWEEQRGERDFPALADIDPAAIHHLWPYCFVLDVSNYAGFPYFQHLGPALARYSGVFLSGPNDWSHTLLKRAVHHYQEALSREAPVLVEEKLTLFDNQQLLFRSVLLPLSDDQRKVDHLLGAANGSLCPPKPAAGR